MRVNEEKMRGAPRGIDVVDSLAVCERCSLSEFATNHFGQPKSRPKILASGVGVSCDPHHRLAEEVQHLWISDVRTTAMPSFL